MSWRTTAYRAVRPLLFATDPESIHHAALRLLASPIGRYLAPIASGVGDPDVHPVDLLGLRFRNRVGLGAGFDKDGVAIRGWAALGFGFVEVGTVTARPQPGNPRPRLFRLPADEALINRMGFNNHGAEAAAARLRRRSGAIVGVNIGKSKVATEAEAEDDYAASARAIAPVADYVVVNVSSPNTPGLRDLQSTEKLRPILRRVRAELDAARPGPSVPLLVKIAPDLADA